MAFEFKLPDLGEGIREAQVLEWKVVPGQDVAAFQALCEVESAKAAVELTAPVAGRIRETRFSEGAIAHLGDVLVVIDTDAEAPTEETAVAGESRGGVIVESPVADEGEWFGIVGSAPPRRDSAVAGPEPAVPRRVRAAPFVRKLARDLGVPLEDLAGSGVHGRVRIADVEAAGRAATHAEPHSSDKAHQLSHTNADVSPHSRTDTVIPLRGLRKSIADHMVQAWRTAPQVTSMDLFDVTELVRAREILSKSTRLSYLPLFVKAAIEALKLVPEANAVVDDERGAIVLKAEYHIGLATAVPGGLVVPVVKHADRLSLLELADEIEGLVSAARERRSTPADLSGSTFTITSFGGLPGSPMFATPILNYPEVAILGLGRIDLQPRVVDGVVVPRQCLGVSLTFDHRVLDGEGAGRFMAALKRYLEQPLELLLHLK